MWKAFQELRASGWVTGPALPRMYSVQATGCAPVIRAFETGAERCTPWPDPTTVAAGLRVPGPLGDRQMQTVEGIDAAPEGGAALAGAVTLLHRGLIKAEERVVVFNTGAGWLYRA